MAAGAVDFDVVTRLVSSETRASWGARSVGSDRDRRKECREEDQRRGQELAGGTSGWSRSRTRW